MTELLSRNFLAPSQRRAPLRIVLTAGYLHAYFLLRIGRSGVGQNPKDHGHGMSLSARDRDVRMTRSGVVRTLATTFGGSTVYSLSRIGNSPTHLESEESRRRKLTGNRTATVLKVPTTPLIGTVANIANPLPVLATWPLTESSPHLSSLLLSRSCLAWFIRFSFVPASDLFMQRAECGRVDCMSTTTSDVLFQHAGVIAPGSITWRGYNKLIESTTYCTVQAP